VPVDLTRPLGAGADFAFPDWLNVSEPGRAPADASRAGA
jgi:hypothetical protein